MRKFSARYSQSEAINPDFLAAFFKRIELINESFLLSSSTRVFQSSDPTRRSGGSCLTQRQTASTITTARRRRPSGTSHKIVISSPWPNCKFSNKTLNHHQMNPKMHHKRFSSAWISTRGIQKQAIKQIAPDETMRASECGKSHVRDPPDLDIPKAVASKSSKPNSTRLTTSSLVSRINFVNTVAREHRATVRNLWILESRATRAFQAHTIIERFRREAALESQVHTPNPATNTILTTPTECSKRAEAPTTFPTKVSISCRQYRIRPIWRRVTASRHRTRQARRWWRRDCNTRIKHQANPETDLRKQLQSTKVSTTDHHKLSASHGLAVSCRQSTAAQRDAPRFSRSGKARSMDMEATIRCMRSTSNLSRIRQCRDEGTRHHPKIVSSRAIPARNHQSVPRIRWILIKLKNLWIVNQYFNFLGHKVSSPLSSRPRVSYQKVYI